MTHSAKSSAEAKDLLHAIKKTSSNHANTIDSTYVKSNSSNTAASKHVHAAHQVNIKSTNTSIQKFSNGYAAGNL